MSEANNITMQRIHKNLGTIKNLTVGTRNFISPNYDAYSAYVYSSRSESTGHTSYVGGLVGCNKGNVINCKVENVKVEGILSNKNDNESAYYNIGGLVGLNKDGIINQCYVNDTYIKSDMPCAENSGDNNLIKIGGLVGRNEENSVINNSIVNYILAYAYAHGDGKLGNDSWEEIMFGGVVGSNSGTLNNCICRSYRTERIR